MGDIVVLSRYRRGVRAGRLLNAEALAHELATRCVVVDALTGLELFGVPSAHLASKAPVGEAVLARLYEAQWMHVENTVDDVAFCRARGWKVQLVRMVRIGTPVSVVTDEQGRAIANLGIELVQALHTGRSLWCVELEGTWRALCDGAFTAAEADRFAWTNGLGELAQRRLRLTRREAGRG